MKKRSVMGGLVLTSALAVLMVACGNKSADKGGSGADKAPTKEIIAKTTNDKKDVPDATFRYGEQASTPFKGIFSNELGTDATDSDVTQFGNESLFKIDSSYQIIDGGAANLKYDKDKKTATITINPKVKWSDGQPLIAEDVLYAYKVIANKDAQSQRYTEGLANIKGLADYHDGKSQEISGITMPDGPTGKTVVISFNEMKPGMVFSGSGYLWESAVPSHIYKKIAFKDLISSDAVRKNPVFYGPYKMTKIVSGQSAEWVPNEYYYGEKPKMKKIIFEVVSPTTVPTAAKSGKYDMLQIGATTYGKIQNEKNVIVVGKDSLSLPYTAFKLGKWDAKKGVNVQDPNAKMGDKNLRLAIAYSMNLKGIAKKIYNGVGTQMSTLIPTSFGEYHDSDLKAYPYDLKKAEKILDDAGYKKGKDGYRTTPEGKKLVINYATQGGNTTSELIEKTKMQDWKKIGLHVVYATGKPMDYNAWTDKIMSDAPGIDMFSGAWSMSSEPSPADLFSEKAQFNLQRFVTKENTDLLNEIDGQKSMDKNYRIEKFAEWQKYMQEQAFMIPDINVKDMYAVTPRVKGLNITPGAPGWEHVSLTAKD